jgi:hypothetical protein
MTKRKSGKPDGAAGKVAPRAYSPSLTAALEDPDLFGGMFDNPSWGPWKVFLKALQAEPMSEAELVVYRKHTGRTDPPSKPSRYAQLVVGRRGGKSRILSLIAVYLACCIDHRPHIVPGETPVIAVIAKDRQQAKIILNYIAGFIREIPVFNAMLEDETAETLRLSNRVGIEVHTSSIGAPRGRTFLAVLCDESAFWPVGDSANPDIEVINAVRPGLVSIPHSLLLIASSPYAKKGLLYTNYAKYFGNVSAPVLVWQGTTEAMNSNLVGDDQITEMFAEDPERAQAEYGAQFRSDLVQFITREAVESVTAHGLIELPPSSGIQYASFVDPSGGSADSMTLAIGHCEASGIAILDCLREVKPPFSPDAVVEEYAALLRAYGISRVIGDNYAGAWPKERFSVHGITYDPSPMTKSTIYQSFLPALNGHRIRLLDSPRLVAQLCNLERRTARGGRDSIDHASNSHDDLANAVAGVLTHLIADRRPALVRAEAMSAPAHLNGYEPPGKAAYVVAFIAAGENGNAAVVYGALDRAAPNALYICDFDTGPMAADTFAGIAARLESLRAECRADNSAIWCAETMLIFARSAGVDAHPFPADFRAEERLLSVAGHVASGAVRITSTVTEKAKTSPFAGALNLRAGENVDDPLRNALISLIALALDNESLAA